MHHLPRQKLSELLAQHGPGLCDDARRLEWLLKDLLRNEHKRETFVLISALREGVAHELRGSTSGIPSAALAAKLVRQLCDNLGLDDGVARWGVESWAVALGVEITQPKAVSITPVTKMKPIGPSTVSHKRCQEPFIEKATRNWVSFRHGKTKTINSGWMGLSCAEPSQRADADLYEG